MAPRSPHLPSRRSSATLTATALAAAGLLPTPSSAQPAPVPAQAAPAVPPAAPPASPTPEAGDALARYRAAVVDIRPAFGTFNGFELKQAGQVVEVGFFGGEAEALFAGSPAALDAMADFRSRRVLGTSMWAAGLAVLMGTLVLTLTESDLVYEKNANGLISDTTTTFWALLGGGAAVGIAGGLIMQSATEPLGTAVDAWNEHAHQRARGAGNTPTALRLGGTF